MTPPPERSLTGRWIAFGVVILALIAIVGVLAKDMTPESSLRKIEGYTKWSKETTRLAETLPVQDGGRVKPFSTYAGFTMLRLYGSRSMNIEAPNPDAEKAATKPLIKVTLKPTDWMLDCLFRPSLAVDFPTFRIDNSAVVQAVGLEGGSKRDRYSYRDLEAARDKLMDLGKSYEAIDSAKRDPVQNQTIDLAYNVRLFESLIGYFGFARNGITMSGPQGSRTTDLATVMQTAPIIREVITKSQQETGKVPEHVQVMLEQVLDAANFSRYGLFLLPPTDSSSTVWLSAGNAIMNVMTQQGGNPEESIDDIKQLEATAQAIGKSEGEFRSQLDKLSTRLVSRAKTDNQYRAVEMEASYYRADWFMNAMVFYFLATFLSIGMVMGSGKTGKVFKWLTALSTSAGLIVSVIAITQRCYIMQRPPIGNLYDTIIFICTLVIALALVIEFLTRKRFALAVAPLAGVLLILLARKFEVGEAKDHMDPLVAVLNSNYWLTIHVITVTAGYAGGLLTAFISFAYVLLRGFGLDGGDRDLRRSLTKVVYGCVCLTLLLSLTGTVLGGIWANDSWGRFWGWDPKENGALMIVLWNLVILHARLGGYIKEWGLHFCALFGSCVVAFSWWHVNFFNTGLHTYGFTNDKQLMLWVFYYFILAVIAFGFIARAIEMSRKSADSEKTTSPPIPKVPELL
jgi:ABC-type transport system involved in cytochrome c biogenesis permease subunit